MSYQIKQLRRGDLSTTDLFTDIGYNINDQIHMASAGLEAFLDVGISSNEGITPGINYFLDFKVKRLYADGEPVSDQGIATLKMTVALINENVNGKYEIVQALEEYTIYPYELENVEEESKYAYISLSFNPIVSADYIGLVLTRNQYDYFYPNERKIEPTVNRFGKINNILPINKVDKIGVQSHPGFLINVNGEPIRVGRSGIFEINNGLKIVSFGTPMVDDNFILDYAWDETS